MNPNNPNKGAAIFKPQAQRGGGVQVTGSAPPDLVHKKRYNAGAAAFVPRGGKSNQGGPSNDSVKQVSTGSSATSSAAAKNKYAKAAANAGAAAGGVGGRFNARAAEFVPTFVPRNDFSNLKPQKEKDLKTVSEENTGYEEQKKTEMKGKPQGGSSTVKAFQNQDGGASKESQPLVGASGKPVQEFRPASMRNTAVASSTATTTSTTSTFVKETVQEETKLVQTVVAEKKTVQTIVPVKETKPIETKPEVKTETKVEAKPEAKVEVEEEKKVEPEVKTETEPEIKEASPKNAESTTVATTTPTDAVTETSSSADNENELKEAAAKKIYSRDIILKFKETESCTLAPADLTIYEFYKKVPPAKMNRGGSHYGNKNPGMLPNPKRTGGGRGGDRVNNPGRRDNRPNTLTRRTYDPQQAQIQEAARKQREVRQNQKDQASEAQRLRMEAQKLTNQITKTNFEAIGKDIIVLARKSYNQLVAVVEQIMKKAWSEPRFCEIYAELCKMLDDAKLSYTEVPKDARKNPFKVALLSKTQEVFEKSAGSRSDGADDEIDEKKVLANVKLIGELFKLGLIKGSIITACASSLLYKKIIKDGVVTLTQEIEYDDKRIYGCCDLLNICGKELLRKKKKSDLEKFVEVLRRIKDDGNVSSKTKFRIMDIVDMQANNWVSTSIKDTKVKTVDEIHQEFKQEQRDAAQRAREMKQDQMANRSGGLLHSSNYNRPVMQRRSEVKKSNIFDQVSALTEDNNEEEDEEEKVEEIPKLPPFASEDEMNTKVLEVFTAYAIRHSTAKLVKDFKYEILSRVSSESDFLYKALNALFDKKEDLMKIYGSCLAVLVERGGYSKESFIAGMATFCEFAPMVEPDIPKLSEYLAIVVSRFLAESTVKLSELRIAISEVEFDQPFYQKFFAQLFKNLLLVTNDQDDVQKRFNDPEVQKVVLKVFLGNQDDMKTAFENKDLGFILVPESHLEDKRVCETELEKKLEEVLEADEIDFEDLSSWISENSKKLSNLTIAETILEEIFELIQEENLSVLNQPEEFFSKFDTILKRYITGNINTQVAFVVQMERFCHDYKRNDFAIPVFNYLYESEIVWEYAFLKYKLEERDHTGYKETLLKETAEFWTALQS
eukprot:CAMPEP_0114993442 /NCGR_PEP_ID=MMETSP0216-20121206/12531_1 /TAXON_ID=223996 /ORGANISM="Protocruzia adherens, Strain Boccale" /LENGTH=1121 /DNA_ID=CAMNT_0002357083 /DNA_START=31 /DNA_END=3396 /DNA_ORIENTATION=-